LYDQEYKGITCTLQSLAGVLAVSGEEAARLMARLAALGLVAAKGEGFQLTAEGRKEALRMIRIHRLWERYLADETGIAETEWHKQAERLEHNMTDEEMEELAARAGYPSYDPHGDPIPTRSGKLPPKKGQPLTDLEEGELAQIIHIEDEPDAIYAQLVAENLHPGMRVRMLERTPERLTLTAQGEEVVLAPVVAANVTVVPLPKDLELVEEPHETLASLQPGERGEVVAIARSYRGQQRRRLMDLGVIPGTVITVEMRSASGDPTAYNIRGATIALRRSQAEKIYIRRIEESGDGKRS
ncbi:MAG: hypothetical protein D6743_14835, partial [Calditrichaeota bacterium]